MESLLAIIIAFLLFNGNAVLAESIKKQASSSVMTKKNPPEQKTRETTDKKQQPLDFSDTGRPGQQTAGGSRTNRSSCSSLDRPLQALIPISNSGKTVSGHPSFWVYFPYNQKQISHVEFILQNEAREDIWRSRSVIDTTTGYQRFSVPADRSPLKEGEWYQWYVKVYCPSQVASAQYVQGWISRVPLSSKLHIKLQDNPESAHKIYSQSGIWYDAIDKLLDLQQNPRGDLHLEQEWQNLLDAKGVNFNGLPSVTTIYEAVK